MRLRGSRAMIHGAASECAPISNGSNIAITRGGRRQRTILSWRKSGARFEVCLESQETRAGTALMGLHTTVADPKLGLGDRQLGEEILSALAATLIDQGVGAIATIESFLSDLFGQQVKARFDPNNWETMKRRPEGLMLIPIAVRDGQRSSPRDYLIEVQKKYPERLIIQTETLVSEILFD